MAWGRLSGRVSGWREAFATLTQACRWGVSETQGEDRGSRCMSVTFSWSSARSADPGGYAAPRLAGPVDGTHDRAMSDDVVATHGSEPLDRRGLRA